MGTRARPCARSSGAAGLGRGVVGDHRVLANHHRSYLSAGRAVRPGWHRRSAGTHSRMGDASCRSKASPSVSAAFSPRMEFRSAVPRGELHAIIGPNGAGKTTLIGQLGGRRSLQTAGASGSTISTSPGCRAGGAASSGLARSFQITSLFADFTVLDNVALAVQAHAGHSFHFWRNAREETSLREPARAVLARLGASRARGRPGFQAESWRAPADRDRHGARDRSAHAPARRANGRDGAG